MTANYSAEVVDEINRITLKKRPQERNYAVCFIVLVNVCLMVKEFGWLPTVACAIAAAIYHHRVELRHRWIMATLMMGIIFSRDHYCYITSHNVLNAEDRVVFVKQSPLEREYSYLEEINVYTEEPLAYVANIPTHVTYVEAH